jgi:hypothetical protein
MQEKGTIIRRIKRMVVNISEGNDGGNKEPIAGFKRYPPLCNSPL